MEPNNDTQAKYSCFAWKIDGAVALLRMTRSSQHNSMTAEFWEELPRILEEIESNQSIRAIVLSAEGDTFSSGMDLSIFQNTEELRNGSAKEKAKLQKLILKYQNALDRVCNCRVPIIAAIQGPCLGAALDLVCRCDIRYAANAAYFTIYEIKLAILADLGTLQYMSTLIGESAVRDLALTGDKLTADRAFNLGFCTAVKASRCEVYVYAIEQAKKIAAHSPKAIAGTRWALTTARDVPIKVSLAQTRKWQASMFDVDEVMEAMTALKERRAPIFSDFAVQKIEL